MVSARFGGEVPIGWLGRIARHHCQHRRPASVGRRSRTGKLGASFRGCFGRTFPAAVAAPTTSEAKRTAEAQVTIPDAASAIDARGGAEFLRAGQALQAGKSLGPSVRVLPLRGYPGENCQRRVSSREPDCATPQSGSRTTSRVGALASFFHGSKTPRRNSRHRRAGRIAGR